MTWNDPALTDRMLPTLKRAANGKVQLIAPLTVAEDFSEFQKVVPGVFVMLGIVPEGQDPKKVAGNHSGLFFADEAALPVGVRTLASLADLRDRGAISVDDYERKKADILGRL